MDDIIHWYKISLSASNSIDREVFLKPPKEADERPNKVWKSNATNYWLTDACRSWPIIVKNKLLPLGVFVSKLDPSFRRCDVHTPWWRSQLFIKNIIGPLGQTFTIGTHYLKALKYLGLNLNKVEKEICTDQTDYIATLKPIAISKERKRNQSSKLDQNKIDNLKTVIGQLSWNTG